jgi:CubicO group peptidase (beta-lactamase class C family)
MIIQKVTGRTWSQFVAERLFTPLGMKNSFPSNDEIPRSTRIAMGHVDGKVIPIYDYEGGKPAAAIYSSVDDLSHWIQMWLEGGKWAGQKILDPRTMRMMQTAQTNIGVSPVWESWGVHFRAYGLGWSLFDYAGKKVVEHNGGMPGYISKVTLIPESNLGFVILNNGNDGTVNEAIRFKILDVLLDHVGKDWDKVYKNFADMGAAGLASETAAREKSRVPNTKPSLALKAYTGTFADPSYGTVSVTESASGDLFFAMDQSKLLFSGNMEHFHLDTWKVQFNDPYLPFALISFEIGPKGDVLGFKIDLPNDDFHFDVLDFKRTNP